MNTTEEDERKRKNGEMEDEDEEDEEDKIRDGQQVDRNAFAWPSHTNYDERR